MDILRKPLDWDMDVLRDAIKKVYPSAFFRNKSDRYVVQLTFDSADIDINYNTYVAEVYGDFNTYNAEGGVISNLEKYFKYPLLPTEEERTLFKIEFGVDYPLPVIRLGGC